MTNITQLIHGVGLRTVRGSIYGERSRSVSNVQASNNTWTHITHNFPQTVHNHLRFKAWVDTMKKLSDVTRTVQSSMMMSIGRLIQYEKRKHVDSSLAHAIHSQIALDITKLNTSLSGGCKGLHLL